MVQHQLNHTQTPRGDIDTTKAHREAIQSPPLRLHQQHEERGLYEEPPCLIPRPPRPLHLGPRWIARRDGTTNASAAPHSAI